MIVYSIEGLISAIGAASGAPSIYRHLPDPIEGNVDFKVPSDVARGLAAVAVLIAESQNNNNTTAVEVEYGVSRYKLLRLRQWIAKSKFKRINPVGIHYRLVLDGATWEVSKHEEHAMLEVFGKTQELDDEKEDKDVAIDDYVMPESVIYIKEEDVYAYYSNKMKKLLRFPGGLIRDMKTDYSNSGSKMSLNEIARKYSIPRNYFHELKTVFGWTHDQSIYTPEELVQEDLQAEKFRATEALERRAMERFQKIEYGDLIKKARNWDNLKLGVLDPFLEAIKQLPPVSQKVDRLVLKSINVLKPGKLASVVTPFDLHYGKQEWSFHEDEKGYSMSEFEDLVTDTTADLIRSIAGHKLKKIFLPIGHDFFNVTNDAHTTSHGTPQDMSGNFIQMITGGSRLCVTMIEMYRRVADEIDVIWVPGNHDREASIAALLYAKGTYHDCKQVKVHIGQECRAYVRWEGNLFGNIHGDGIKMPDLPRIMASEVRSAWGAALNTMWFTGHLHFEKMTDIFGTQIFQAPSLSGTDRWHHRKLYEGSRRSLEAYILHESAGKIHQDSVPLPKQESRSLLIEA